MGAIERVFDRRRPGSFGLSSSGLAKDYLPALGRECRRIGVALGPILLINNTAAANNNNLPVGETAGAHHSSHLESKKYPATAFVLSSNSYVSLSYS